MKIRIMGPPDIVEAWAAEMARRYGVTPVLYPCRNSNQKRAYIDIDDREAAAMVEGLVPARPARGRLKSAHGDR